MSIPQAIAKRRSGSKAGAPKRSKARLPVRPWQCQLVPFFLLRWLLLCALFISLTLPTTLRLMILAIATALVVLPKKKISIFPEGRIHEAKCQCCAI